MNTNKLMEMYNSTFQPALQQGVYEVKMTKHEYVKSAKENGTDYIKFTYEVLSENQKGRVLTDNKFEKGFGVMISHLRQQLKRDNEEIVVQNFLNELVKNATPFKIWVVKRNVDGVQRTNFNFLEPIAETTPNTEVVDDLIESTPF